MHATLFSLTFLETYVKILKVLGRFKGIEHTKFFNKGYPNEQQDCFSNLNPTGACFKRFQ